MNTHTKLPLFHFALIVIGVVLVVSGLLARQFFAAESGNRKIVLSSQQFASATNGNMVSVGASSNGGRLALADCHSSVDRQGNFAINCPTGTSGPQVAGEQDKPLKPTSAVSSFSVIIQIITALMRAAGF